MTMTFISSPSNPAPGVYCWTSKAANDHELTHFVNDHGSVSVQIPSKEKTEKPKKVNDKNVTKRTKRRNNSRREQPYPKRPKISRTVVLPSTSEPLGEVDYSQLEREDTVIAKSDECGSLPPPNSLVREKAEAPFWPQEEPADSWADLEFEDPTHSVLESC